MLFSVDRDKDTIAAIATPAGVGGISVIRISGKESTSIVKKLCRFMPDHPESHRVYYGFFKSLNENKDLDEVLLSYFQEGKSFTGEDTVEVACHGGSYITQALFEEILSAGARIAERGEFTYRAYINGRIDLVQAESVLSLIESESSKSARVSLRQLKGQLSNKLNHIEDQLIWCLANIEANIDFAAEDILVASSEALLKKCTKALSDLKELSKTYKQGRMLKQGMQIALAGAPNVGKSTILNLVSGEDRAIVTDIPGTTRDFLEAKIQVNGVTLSLIDTAGLRKTEDKVEKLGIERSEKVILDSDFVVVILDLSKELAIQLDIQLGDTQPENTVFLGNKVDIQKNEYSKRGLAGLLAEQSLSTSLLEFIKKVPDTQFIKVSSMTSQGMQPFESLLESFTHGEFSEDSAIIVQTRHFELLNKAIQALKTSIENLVVDESPDFTALDLQQALLCIQEILGKKFDDQVMDRVFNEFCLGK